MRTTLPLLALLAAHAPLVGCEEPQAEICEDILSTPAFLELGTGNESFEPLLEGEALELHFGGQGAQHVYLSLYAEGLNPGHSPLFSRPEDTLDLDISVWQDGAEIGGLRADWITMAGDSTGAELVGAEIVLWPDWGLLDEDPIVEIRATLVDACGTEITLTQDQTLG